MAILEFIFPPPTPAERKARQARIQAAAARHGTSFRARLAAQVEQEADARFMAAHFPQIAAARYALPGGALGDPTPISKSPSATPATNPPTGAVTRPPQRPPSAAPAAYRGPAVPPATPRVQVTPLGPRTPARAQFFTWA